MQEKLIALLPDWFKSIHSLLANNVDKVAHFSFMYMVADIILKYEISIIIISLASFIIAIGKEIFDKLVTNKWSLLDFIFTFLGGILAIIINK